MVIFFSDGKIAAIGNTSEIQTKWNYSDYDEVIDGKGKCILPGFVDAHTHPVWAGDRVHEFAMKVYFNYTIILIREMKTEN